MICLNCKKETKSNVCPYCGHVNNEKVLEYLNDPNVKRNIDQYNQNVTESFFDNNTDSSIVNVFNSNNSDNIKYIQAFIGDKYNDFINGGISWCVLLFGYIYIAYRKMYGYALFIFLIFSIINIFLNSFFAALFWIFIAFRFKDKYILFANNEVNILKKEHINISEEELLLICRKKGGTNIFMAFLYIVGLTIVNYLLYYYLKILI